MDELSQQAIIDTEHLRLLRIAYFIAAGTNLIWVFFPLMYVAMGAFMFSGGFGAEEGPGGPPRSFAIMFISIGLGVSLFMATLTTLKALTGRAIGRRRGKSLIMVTAALTCFGVPWGTALGVLTFMVLTRPSVAQQFESST